MLACTIPTEQNHSSWCSDSLELADARINLPHSRYVPTNSNSRSRMDPGKESHRMPRYSRCNLADAPSNQSFPTAVARSFRLSGKLTLICQRKRIFFVNKPWSRRVYRVRCRASVIWIPYIPIQSFGFGIARRVVKLGISF